MPTFAKAPVSRLRRPAARQFRSNRWKEYFGGALLGEGAQLRSSWDEQLTASRPEPRSGTGVCRQRIAESTDRAGRNRDPCHSGSKKLFLIARQWSFPRPWAERKRIQGSAPGLSKSHCRAFSCPGVAQTNLARPRAVEKIVIPCRRLRVPRRRNRFARTCFSRTSSCPSACISAMRSTAW